MQTRLLLVLFFTTICFSAQARVFKFSDEGVAAFFSGGFGDALILKDNAYAKSSGTGTKFSDEVPYTQFLELGFLMTPMDKLTLRFSAEVFQAKTVSGAKGKDSGGTELLSLDSSVFVFNPSLIAEVSFYNSDQSKAFFFGGAGYSTLSVDNEYSFTTAGLAAFSNVSADYTEKLEANFISYQLGVGYEILFVDNVTFTSTLGYRVMEALDISHKGNSEAIGISGGVSKGDRAKFNDGANRNLNLGGTFLQVGFRFYVDFI